MKKMTMLLAVVFVFLANSVQALTYNIEVESNQLCLEFPTQWTGGNGAVASMLIGDGYTFYWENQLYFLPTGTKLILEPEKKYGFKISQIIRENHGYIVVDSVDIVINKNGATPGEILGGAQKIDSGLISSYLVAPRIWVEKGYINISPYVIQGPPTHPDSVVAKFILRGKTFCYNFPASGGKISIKDLRKFFPGSGYCQVEAKSMFYDSKGGRLIISKSANYLVDF